MFLHRKRQSLHVTQKFRCYHEKLVRKFLIQCDDEDSQRRQLYQYFIKFVKAKWQKGKKELHSNSPSTPVRVSVMLYEISPLLFIIS